MVLKLPKGLMRSATSFGEGFIGGLVDQAAAEQAKDDRYQEKLENLEFFRKEEAIKAGIKEKKDQQDVDDYLDILSKEIGQGVDREWFNIYAPIATTSVDNARAWYSGLQEEFKSMKPFSLVLAPDYGSIPFKDFYQSQYTQGSTKSSQNKDQIAENVGKVNNISDNTANVLLANNTETNSTRSDASGSYSASSFIPFNFTAITGPAKKNRVGQQFFTHPDLGVVEAYQYETSPGSNVGDGIFYTMMEGEDGELAQARLTQTFFNQAQEGIANRTSKSYEFFDKQNNKHHVISGYEQGGINYVTGLPTNVASIINYKLFDKLYTPNYNVDDLRTEDFLGEGSVYKPFFMKLDDFNVLFQNNTQSNGLFREVGTGTTTETFGTSQSEIKSLVETFASVSKIATKENFVIIGEGENATTQLRFLGDDQRSLAGRNVEPIVTSMLDNHDRGVVPQETYDALNIGSITSKANLVSNAARYTGDFIDRVVRVETNNIKDLKGEAFRDYIRNAGFNPDDYREGNTDDITNFATEVAYKTVSNAGNIEAIIAINNSIDEQEAAAQKEAGEAEAIAVANKNAAVVNSYFPSQTEDFSSYVKEFVRDKGDEQQITMLLTDLRNIANTEEDYNALEEEAARIVDGLPDFQGRGPDSDRQEQATAKGTDTESIANLSVAPEYPPRLFGKSQEEMEQNRKEREEWKNTYGEFFFEDGTKKTGLQIEAIANGRPENSTRLYVDRDNYRKLNNIE